MADVTYTYTSRPLQSNTPGVQVAPMTIVLDFSSDGSTLLDWSISQPDLGTIDPSNVFVSLQKQYNDSPAIYLYTDASGKVDDWFIHAIPLDPSSTPAGADYSKWALSWYGVVLGAPPLPLGLYAEDTVPGGFSVNGPGTWTSSGGVLRDFGYGDRADLATLPVPEPPAGLLALLGLAALGVVRRKARPVGPVDCQAR
ncbi:MAG TPA: PEP-CTERM sorting domain-containing protein [Burkholderiaceae bacterium]